MRRWQALIVAVLSAAVLTVATPGPVGAVSPSTVRIGVDGVVGGFSNPVLVTNAGDRSYRMFVVEQGGLVKVVHTRTVQSAPYLNLTGRVATSGGEQGLLSIAFHPKFATHPFVYAAYTRSSDGSLVVSRFSASSSKAASVAASTEKVLLVVPHPNNTNHNGGQLAFGPDGYLYISTGDGGGGGDPAGNAESLSSLSGKILRINVDATCGSTPYCIPASNPFARSTSARRQILDYGLRNPWRFSFDRSNGTLWIGDVGQAKWEEVDHVSTTLHDLGWSCSEGLATYSSSRCTISGHRRSWVRPVAVYSHSDGSCAIIGGFAYQGPKYPFAKGIYLYDDYCSGKFRGIGRTSSGAYVATTYGTGPDNPTGFGESDSGEIYLVTQGGSLYHVRFVQR